MPTIILEHLEVSLISLSYLTKYVEIITTIGDTMQDEDAEQTRGR